MEIEDTSSNDVVDLNSDSEDETCNDKPLIALIKRLIGNENKQVTFLTNSQIVNILKKEFNIDIRNLHSLEIDVHLTIMKKYLKDWPGWDELDKDINHMQSKGCNLEKSILEMNYTKFKEYLKTMLDIVQPLAKDASAKLQEKIKITRNDEPKADDPVLEIQAAQSQLKNLFYRHPNRKSKNLVFNISTNLPSQIKINTIPLRSILNWWGVSIYLTSATDQLLYKRETKHEFKHVLINKRLFIKSNPPIELKQTIEHKGSVEKIIEINEIIKVMEKISYLSANKQMSEVYDFIKTDLALLPSNVFQRTIYKRYTNKYPYVRYLYQDIEKPDVEDIQMYDIQLEETIAPTYQLYLGDFSNIKYNVLPKELRINCDMCKVKFKGENVVTEVKAHFNEQHHNENDFMCTSCRETFSTESLAANWWCHKCT